MWSRFCVMSNSEWHRCKRRNKHKSTIAKYYANDCSLRNAFERKLDSERQKTLPSRLFLSKLSQQLYFMAQEKIGNKSDIEALELIVQQYKEAKLRKAYDYLGIVKH